jgi:hypothetical protein
MLSNLRPVVGTTLVLVGVALFVFYFFSFRFSASGGGPVNLGWNADAGYDVHARVGLAVGAILVVAGVFVRKAVK